VSDLPTPPFSPPIKWILDCVPISSAGMDVMERQGDGQRWEAENAAHIAGLMPARLADI
jgi:hypothetical protein